MGPAGDQGELHVGDGGACEHPRVGLLSQMGEDQPLPVSIQLVLRAGRGKAQPAPPLSRLQQQVHLGIVAQRLEVSHPLYRCGNGLPVDYLSGAEIHCQTEAAGDDPAEDLRLHGPHEPQMELPQPLVPLQMELGVLLLQLPEFGEGGMGITALREDELIDQCGLQHRRGPAAAPPPGPVRAGCPQARSPHTPSRRRPPPRGEIWPPSKYGSDPPSPRLRGGPPGPLPAGSPR